MKVTNFLPAFYSPQKMPSIPHKLLIATTITEQTIQPHRTADQNGEQMVCIIYFSSKYDAKKKVQKKYQLQVVSNRVKTLRRLGWNLM